MIAYNFINNSNSFSNIYLKSKSFFQMKSEIQDKNINLKKYRIHEKDLSIVVLFYLFIILHIYGSSHRISLVRACP